MSSGTRTSTGPAGLLLLVVGVVGLIMMFGLPKLEDQSPREDLVVFYAAGTSRNFELSYDVISNVRGSVDHARYLLDTTTRREYVVMPKEHLTVQMWVRLPDLAKPAATTCQIYHAGKMVSHDMAARGADKRVNAPFAFCKYTTP